MKSDLALLEETLAPLLSRRSVSPKRLGKPAPDAAELDLMVQAALRSPDHGGLHPWRIIEFPETVRPALAERFEQEKLRRDPLTSASDLAKAREHAMRPPMLLGFVVGPRARTQIPEREQVIAAGAALANLMNAVHRMGYGACILSGERCFDPDLVTQLGLGPQEWLAGFVSIGTVREAPPPARPVESGPLLSRWLPQESNAQGNRAVAPSILTVAPDGLASTKADQDLPYETALELIRARLRPVSEAEEVPLAWARCRVLAAPLMAAIDVPAYDNAAMDGYALRGEDLAPDGMTELLAVDEPLLAGQLFTRALQRGQCLPIMTGAPMPAGLDTVVPVEHCEVLAGSVRIPSGRVRRGDNVRTRGEDFAKGAIALDAGRRLQPADLGVAASLGHASLPVLRPLRVAVLSCGDELTTPGDALEPGRIYDSNRYGLTAALQEMGFDVLDLGRLADDRERLDAALLSAAERVDSVISSGGVGDGEADLVGRFLRTHGEEVCRHVAMRPGRPFTCGLLPGRAGARSVWHFALPGNPVAALVAFEVLVRESLQALAGARGVPRLTLTARTDVPLKKRAARTEFQRGVVRNVGGVLQVTPTVAQGSGILRSLSEANALIVLRHDQGAVKPGDAVDVWMLDGRL